MAEPSCAVTGKIALISRGACAARVCIVGWPAQRAYQYLLLEKSPSRRCMMACQKLPVGFSSDCEIVCDSSRKSKLLRFISEM